MTRVKDHICQKLASASEKACIGELRQDVTDRRRLSCRTALKRKGMMLSPGSGVTRAEIRNRLAVFGRRRLFRGGPVDPAELQTPEFAGGHAGLGLERALEGAERLKTGIQCDGQDRDRLLRRVRERRHHIVEAIAVQEGIEVAVSETPVDQSAQAVFGDAQLCCEAPDRKPSSRYALS